MFVLRSTHTKDLLEYARIVDPVTLGLELVSRKTHTCDGRDVPRRIGLPAIPFWARVLAGRAFASRRGQCPSSVRSVLNNLPTLREPSDLLPFLCAKKIERNKCEIRILMHLMCVIAVAKGLCICGAQLCLNALRDK